MELNLNHYYFDKQKILAMVMSGISTFVWNFLCKFQITRSIIFLEKSLKKNMPRFVISSITRVEKWKSRVFRLIWTMAVKIQVAAKGEIKRKQTFVLDSSFELYASLKVINALFADESNWRKGIFSRKHALFKIENKSNIIFLRKVVIVVYEDAEQFINLYVVSEELLIAKKVNVIIYDILRMWVLKNVSKTNSPK